MFTVHVIVMFGLYNESVSVICSSRWQREASLKVMPIGVGVFCRTQNPYDLICSLCKTLLSFMVLTLFSSMEKALRQRSQIYEFNCARKVPVLQPLHDILFRSALESSAWEVS